MNKELENRNFDFIDDFFDEISPSELKKTEQRMINSKKIADALSKKGWKKKDLKDAMNLKSQSIVTKWLSGTHNFTQDSLVEIGLVLDIDFFATEPPVNHVINFCLSTESDTSDDWNNLVQSNVNSVNIPLTGRYPMGEC